MMTVTEHREQAAALVAIASLRVEGYRVDGIDRGHVRALMETPERWTPILVDRSSRAVVDGAHRVHAARELGHETIQCEFFSGSRDEAQLEFLRRNIRHGLPLGLRDRKHAAATLLCSQPLWSDRRIAELCALSPHTVCAVRAERPQTAGDGRPTEQNARLDGRIGRDGRVRPGNTSALRASIAAQCEARPSASLREIASATGASPETVRSVKREIEHRSSAGSAPKKEPVVPSQPWGGDAALRSMDDGEFLEWFNRTDLRDEYMEHARRVPVSRVYEVAQDAKRRADLWREFAAAVESRAATRSSS